MSSVHRRYLYSIWPEFSCLEADLDRISQTFAEMRELCRLGFDTTRYACEILKSTIQWHIESPFRVMPKQGDEDVMGSATVERYGQVGNDPPFKIKVTISSELFWPLLVDEYSSAEKATAAFMVAATMLHELSVSIVIYSDCSGASK